MFKTYKVKKNSESWGKNPLNYKNVCNETDVYEQKPIKIDDFSEVEEKEIKQCIEKWKNKEVVEKTNF